LVIENYDQIMFPDSSGKQGREKLGYVICMRCLRDGLDVGE